MSTYEKGTPLTAAERARLHPDVDPARVDRLMTGSSVELRSLLVVAFVRTITTEDLVAADLRPLDAETLALFGPGERPVWLGIRFDDPELQEIWDAEQRRMGAPEGPSDAHWAKSSFPPT